jgi:hypothetical protein
MSTTLLEEVNLRAQEIHTDGYPMSIGELASLYKDGEIDIHPEFQRIFRWKIEQKSKLVESILLGIPIPSIFVSQREDGVWDVVDGLQRLSTIFEFMGILKGENNELVQGSAMIATKHLPSLEGKKWIDELPENELDNVLKIEFKRVKIDVKIVKKQSDQNIKFELFQRINTLGSRLSDQEVRNCLLIMINKKFYEWLKNLSNNENFLNSLVLADRLIDEQYHMELALRFFIYKNINLTEIRGVNDLGEFITNKMVEYAENSSFDYNLEQSIFENTFSYIFLNLGENAFKKFIISKNEFQGKFLLSTFECTAIGIGKNIDSINNINRTELIEITRNLWSDQVFLSKTGSGITASSRLPVLIPIGERLYKYEN